MADSNYCQTRHSERFDATGRQPHHRRPSALGGHRIVSATERMVRATILAILAAFAFAGVVKVAEDQGLPSCTLVDPAEVDAGLDYADNTWTYPDGARFGFAPEEDSFITPQSCYDERNP